MKRVIYGIMLTVFFVSMLVLAFNIRSANATRITVPDNYPTIQAAINHANEGDTVLVRPGVYYERVIVNKSISLIGEDKSTTVIDGNGTLFFAAKNSVVYISANSVLMSGFTVRGSGGSSYWDLAGGICSASNETIISGNLVEDNNYGIIIGDSYYVKGVENNAVVGNVVQSNSYGIFGFMPVNDTVSSNTVSKNDFGIRFIGLFGNNSNTISNNLISDNGEGILLQALIPLGGVASYNSAQIPFSFASENTISLNTVMNNSRGIDLQWLNNNTLGKNLIANNQYGVYFTDSSNNTVSKNNFVNDTNQVWVDHSANTWDAGYPSGGNYWSKYNGSDYDHGKNQNFAGSDGIGDNAYIIDTNNTDRYPLMGPFETFNAGAWNKRTYYVDIVSESNITNFSFNPTAKTLSFNVTGRSGAMGFCRVAIPLSLMSCANLEDWIVTVNGTMPIERSITTDANCTYIYFTYHHSTELIHVQSTNAVPEFQSQIILILIVIATLLAAVVCKRKHNPKSD